MCIEIGFTQKFLVTQNVIVKVKVKFKILYFSDLIDFDYLHLSMQKTKFKGQIDLIFSSGLLSFF